MFSLNSGLNDKARKTELDEILFAKYKEPTGMAGFGHADTTDLFNQLRYESGAYIFAEHMGPGKFIRHREEEEVQDTSGRTFNKTTKETKEWKLDLPIPREFYRDDQHAVVKKDVADMARQARNSQDENCFSIYVGGFDSETTADGSYVFANDHTNGNGDTIDNLETGAMSPDNIELLIRKLYEQKDQRGRLGGQVAQALLVPPALMKTARVNTESELEPGTGDNDANYLSLAFNGMRVYQSPWVGSTYASYTNADTSYYVVGQNHFMNRGIREDLFTGFVNWQNDPDKKDRYIYQARYSETAFAGSWQGVIASNGTA